MCSVCDGVCDGVWAAYVMAYVMAYVVTFNLHSAFELVLYFGLDFVVLSLAPAAVLELKARRDLYNISSGGLPVKCGSWLADYSVSITN